MANSFNINNSAISDMSNNVADVTIDPLQLDGVNDQDENTYQHNDFAQYWGYFNAIPELKSALLSKAIWNVGKGYETNDIDTEVVLDHITGWGKDTFKDILFNMEVVRRIAGDAFAEIIRDEKTGKLLNLKPLDPSSIKIVVGKNGVIKRYEQINKSTKSSPIKFKPEEIFHLSNNRLADQIHGISDIQAIEENIKADNESFVDMRKIMHRSARPMIMFKLGTDDTTKIAQFITKMDSAVNKGENIYIPDDANSVNFEVVKVDVSPSVMAWRDDLRRKFYRTIGLPELLPSGGGDATESGGKIGYLAFEQLVEHDQSFIENQIWAQLQLKINLIPPSSLSADLHQDQAKDGAMAGMLPQPSDTMAGVGR